MPQVADILTPHCTAANIQAASRKRVLEISSDLLASENAALSERKLFDALTSRERLGSTGIGDGVAIPHCRMDCDKITAAFLKLTDAVDYEADDGQPVDLLFVLVVPSDEQAAHLVLLGELASLFNDAENREHLRNASNDKDLYDRLLELLKTPMNPQASSTP